MRVAHISPLSLGTQYFCILHLIYPFGQSQSICDFVQVYFPFTGHQKGFVLSSLHLSGGSTQSIRSLTHILSDRIFYNAILDAAQTFFW